MHTRRKLTLFLAIPLALLLSACGGGNGGLNEASIGTNERTDSNDALGFALVVDGEGNGRIVGTLINTTDEPQALVGADVTPQRGGPATAAVIGERLELPSDKPVELAREPAISVSAEGELPVGYLVELTLDIESGEPLEMLVPVEAQEGPYAEIEVTEPPDGDVSPS